MPASFGLGFGKGGDSSPSASPPNLQQTTSTSSTRNNKENASSNSNDIDKSTPWVASSDGDLSLLQQSLSQLKLSPDVADSNGFTLLHAASSYCQIEIMNWLLSSQQQPSVNVNAPDTDGDTPLHHCDDVQAAKLLVEVGGADFMIRNLEGKTAREVKEEELREGDDDEDEEEDDSDEDDEDKVRLHELVEYLKQLEDSNNNDTRDGDDDEEMS